MQTTYVPNPNAADGRSPSFLNDLATNTPQTAINPITNGGTGGFPLALVANSVGTAVWIKMPKIYRAVLNMDTSAVVVLENTLGGTVVVTKTETGIFDFTLVGAFPANKCIFSCNVSTDNVRYSLLQREGVTDLFVLRVFAQDGSQADEPEVHIQAMVYP